MTTVNQLIAVIAFALLASPVQGETLVSDDLIIDGKLCVGPSCAAGETFSSFAVMHVKHSNAGILFEDTSNPAGTFPSNDWAILINDIVSDGEEYFAVQDRTANTVPFRVMAGAPENALYLAPDGNLGLGTMLPQLDLHLADITEAGIRFEDTDGTPYIWDLSGNSSGFYLFDPQITSIPFEVRSGAPNGTIFAEDDGFIGLGTRSPEGKLHTKGNGVQLAYFESGNGDAVQVRFRTDSENRRFLAVDNADNVKTQMQFRDDAILFLGQTVAQEWLRVDANGITTAGPSCGSPCDAVFDPDAFTVPPIAERAAVMWEQKHLPAIGPTSPDAPINLTEKMGGVIHELEVAHIYIEELNERLEAQDAEKADLLARLEAQDALNAELLARIARLEERD